MRGARHALGKDRTPGNGLSQRLLFKTGVTIAMLMANTVKAAAAMSAIAVSGGTGGA